MRRPKYRVVEEHRASFPNAMMAVESDVVTVGREDPEMPGWHWCRDRNGVDAWVPESHISIQDDKGVFTQDYNSVELNARKGEIIQYLGETLGWVECLNSEWRYGWIPRKKVAPV